MILFLVVWRATRTSVDIKHIELQCYILQFTLLNRIWKVQSIILHFGGCFECFVLLLIYLFFTLTRLFIVYLLLALFTVYLQYLFNLV